ncbi:MAG: WD40 repeat domain-containing protein [Spirochaetales bacterium]|nr:WD40 repeat domain-containing protein [Spirochaetales bacterium]
MNKTLFLPLIIIFFVFYFFFFPLEGSFETVWTGSASTEVSKSESSFEKRGDTFSLNSSMGGETVRFKGPGFPLILEGRYFAADYGAAYICEYSGDGEMLWSWQGLAPVSALSWNRDLIAAGSIDGVVRIFDREGSLREIRIPSEGADHAVYGLSLSPSSRTISVIAGFREQSLYIYSLEDAALIRTEVLDSDYRRPVKMYGTEGEQEMLWVEQPRGLLCFYDAGDPLFVPVEGTLLSMKRDETSALVYIISKTRETGTSAAGGPGDYYHLKIISPEGDLLLKNRFKSFPGSFDVQDDTVLFTMNRELHAFEREEL